MSFLEIGVALQQTSRSVQEANSRYAKSCEICSTHCNANCKSCCITAAHETAVFVHEHAKGAKR